MSRPSTWADVKASPPTRRYKNHNGFCFQSLSNSELLAWREPEDMDQKEAARTSDARLLVATAVDPETHQRVFARSDVDMLIEHDAALIAELVTVAANHAVGSQTEVEEDIAKN